MTDENIEATEVLEMPPVQDEAQFQEHQRQQQDAIPAWAEEIIRQNQELHQKVQSLAQAPEPDETWKYSNEALRDTLRADMQAERQLMHNELVIKPRVIEEAVRMIAGNHADAQAAIRRQLEVMPMAQLSEALRNPSVKDALSLMAEGAKARSARPSVQAPTQERVNNPSTAGALSSADEQEAVSMMRSFKEAFGVDYTIEQARDAVRRAKEQM